MGKVVDIKDFSAKHKVEEAAAPEIEKKFPEYFKTREDEAFSSSMNYAATVLYDILESNFEMGDGELYAADVVMLCESIASIICRRNGIPHPFHSVAGDLAKPFEPYYRVRDADGEEESLVQFSSDDEPESDPPKPPSSPEPTK